MKYKIILTMALAGTSINALAVPQTMVSGSDWKDNNGNLIEAHGGHVIKTDKYYLIGQDRTHNSNTFYALNCYSSEDLVNWTYQNAILTPEKNPELPSGVIVARPKFIYNEATNSYVLWAKYRDPNGISPNMQSIVASSKTPCGDYSVEKVHYPEVDGNKYYTGDNAILLDDDGQAYYAVSTVGSLDVGGPGTVVGGVPKRHIKIFRLTPDFRSFEELIYSFPIEEDKKKRREGPALAKMGDKYVIFSSGTTGWTGNQQKYAVADSMAGPWSDWKNIGSSDAFHSQTAYLIPVKKDDNELLIYGADRHIKNPLKDSRYVWLPIKGDGENLTMDFMKSWSVDVEKAEWRPTIDASLDTNVLTGNAVLKDCSNAEHSTLISKLGVHGSNQGAVVLDKLYVEKAGNYKVVIQYFTEVDRNVELFLNGVLLDTVNFPSSGLWCSQGGTARKITLDMELKKGNNQLEITNSTGKAPTIDTVSIDF